MTSLYDPRPLLEPTNLLEPLDLTPDPMPPAVRAEQAGSSQRGMQAVGVRRASRGERRSLVRPILVLAGALACFAAGTFFPQFQTLTRGNVEPGPTVATASRPPGQTAGVAAKLDVEAKSAEKKQALRAGTALETAATGLETNSASGDHDISAATQPSPPAEPAKPVEPAPDSHIALAGNQQPCPKDDANCLEGGPSLAKELTRSGSVPKPSKETLVATPQLADPERVDTRPSARQVRQEPQASGRSKRAAQRERTDRQARGTRNAGTATGWSRAEDRPDWRREPTEGGRQERVWDRASIWRRDRYDDDPREGGFRAARDDLGGRKDRRENPLMPTVPATRIDNTRGNGGRASLPAKRLTVGFWDWN
jgi:hypothetical protein